MQIREGEVGMGQWEKFPGEFIAFYAKTKMKSASELGQWPTTVFMRSSCAKTLGWAHQEVQ